MKEKEFMNQKAGDMTVSELAEAIKIHQRLASEPAKVEEKTLSDKIDKYSRGNVLKVEDVKQALDKLWSELNQPLRVRAREIFGNRLIW